MDNINHPSHYCKGGIECIDAIKASMTNKAFEGYCKGNVMKYIFRYEDKGGIEDLEKAQVYLGWLIETASEKADGNEESGSFAELIDDYLCCTCAKCGHSFATENIPPVEFDLKNHKAWIDIDCPNCGEMTDYQLDEASFRAIETTKFKNGNG